MEILIDVSKEEFDKFITEYPRHLDIDWYMDTTSYNDFEIGDWPYSIVATIDGELYKDVSTQYHIATTTDLNALREYARKSQREHKRYKQLLKWEERKANVKQCLQIIRAHSKYIHEEHKLMRKELKWALKMKGEIK